MEQTAAGAVRLFTIFVLLGVCSTTLAQSPDLYTAFPQLVNLTYQPQSASSRSVFHGGQNFTHCCLLAVNSSLEVTGNGTIVPSPAQYFIDVSPEELINATKRSQFPCTAKWAGDFNGAPVVEVPYPWLATTCPGWQLASNEWISPFVGFLLPAVVFCLTVPRRRKLTVWKKLFLSEMDKIVSWLIAPVAIAIAGLVVVVDTVFWLSTCFAFASPMLMSGFMEAWLDSVLISFLQDKMENRQTTLDMRARILFVVLCGNLDLDPKVRPGDQRRLDDISRRPTNDSMRFPNIQGDPDHKPRNASSPWTHIENLVHPLRMYGDTAKMTPRQSALHDQTCIAHNCKNQAHTEEAIPRDAHFLREVARTKTRLRTMLACQYSFGATVGAPVVFFLGTFVFTIVDTLARLGDKNSSESLAFGMWYMIIPHLSIVSGLLLAGNNPNTLEGVVAHEFGESEEPDEHHTKLDRIFELNYDSRYKPQWLWFRGRSKREWIEKVCRTYEMRPATGRRGSDVLDEDIAALKKATSPTLRNWALILGMTLMLMGVPFSLGLITVFYTPPIGVACRGLTFIVYTICQVAQIVMWLWAYAGCPEEGNWLVQFRRGGFFDRHGFWAPTDRTSLLDSKSRWTLNALWVIIWYSLAAIFGLGGVFTALGGTIMQLMGVYNSGKCDLPASYWTQSAANQKVVLSSNSALQIMTAAIYWKACAITATIFLGVVCFGGWWYQRRLRGLFRVLVKDLDSPRTNRIDVVHVDASPVLGESVNRSIISKTETETETETDIRETHEMSTL